MRTLEEFRTSAEGERLRAAWATPGRLSVMLHCPHCHRDWSQPLIGAPLSAVVGPCGCALKADEVLVTQVLFWRR